MTPATLSVGTVADSKLIIVRRAGNAGCPYAVTPGLNLPTEKAMANIFIELRLKGHPERGSVEEYVVEDHADQCPAHVRDHHLGARARLPTMNIERSSHSHGSRRRKLQVLPQRI
jgi:hypothetical protein